MDMEFSVHIIVHVESSCCESSTWREQVANEAL